jgi:hypothetical protein
VKKEAVAVLVACSVSGACGSEPTTQGEPADVRFEDEAMLRCVVSDKSGWHSDTQEGYYPSLDRTGAVGSAFRARYRVADDGMTAIEVFMHTIPLFEQVHFPAPVEAASLTFLRTEPEVFLLFQLDPWDGDTAAFTWVERRQEKSFMAHGQCTIAG